MLTTPVSPATPAFERRSRHQTYGYMPRHNPILGTFQHAPSAANGRSRFFREDVLSRAEHERRKSWRHNPFTGQFHMGPKVYSKLHGLHNYSRLRKSMSSSAADRLAAEDAGNVEGLGEHILHPEHGHQRTQTSVSESDLDDVAAALEAEAAAAAAAAEDSDDEAERVVRAQNPFLRFFRIDLPDNLSEGTVSVPDHYDYDGHLSDSETYFNGSSFMFPTDQFHAEYFESRAARIPMVPDETRRLSTEDNNEDDEEQVPTNNASVDEEDEEDDPAYSSREVSSFGLGFSGIHSVSQSSGLSSLLSSGNGGNHNILANSRSTPPPLVESPPLLPTTSFSVARTSLLLDELSLPPAAFGSSTSSSSTSLSPSGNGMTHSSSQAEFPSAPMPITLRRRCRSTGECSATTGQSPPSPRHTAMQTYMARTTQAQHQSSLPRPLSTRSMQDSGRGRSSTTSNFSSSTSASNGPSQGGSDEEALSDDAIEANPWIINRTQEITTKYKVDMSKSGSLGKGAYSVCKICSNRSTGHQFAVKIVRKRLLVSEEEKQMVKREVELHQVLRHRNVVRLYEIFEDSKRLFLVMEKLDGGDLEHLLLRRGGKLPESDCRHIIGQVLEAVTYLHGYGVLQGDLKPANLLLARPRHTSASDEIPVSSLVVKLCDFGLSRKVPDVKYYKYTGDVHKVPYTDLVGTMGYVAPEILRQESYTIAVDIWAVGIILYEMLSGIRPFVPYKDCLTESLAFPTPVFGHVSKEALGLVVKLLNRDATERFTAAEALQHVWLRDRGREAFLL
mmetsp:Transcript_16195/g.31340  ORF Transcript_16195/g.31340 Transcript_16195/m.31340 type:complete len:787 (+) Transcript_16195:1178-3538(+)